MDVQLVAHHTHVGNSTSVNAHELIVKYEGFRSSPYRLPGENFLTIGYGRTGAYWGERTTRSEERAWLFNRIEEERRFIRRYKLGLNANQENALISFVYNVGKGNFAKSNLLRRLRNRDPYASRELLKWNKGSNRRVLPGLVRRRREEYNLFNTPVKRSEVEIAPLDVSDLARAAHYSSNENHHQVKAWNYLQEQLDPKEVEQFFKFFRNKS